MSKPFNSSVEPSSGPLRGMKIVEFAGMGPGPFAAMLLADMGADIVRIERPDAPDELVSGQVVDCAMCDGAISLMTAIYE